MPAADTDVLRKLTRRELEILQLVSGGRSNRQVAEILWVADQTVKFHLANIYRKLNVRSRFEAARWAREAGLLDVVVEHDAAIAVNGGGGTAKGTATSRARSSRSGARSRVRGPLGKPRGNIAMTPNEYCRVRAPRHCTSAVYRPAVTRTDRLIRFLMAGAATVSSPALLSESEHEAASGVSSCISKRPRPTRKVERKPRLKVPVSNSVCRVNSCPGRGSGPAARRSPAACRSRAGGRRRQQAEPAKRGDGIDPAVGDALDRPRGHAHRRDDLAAGQARILREDQPRDRCDDGRRERGAADRPRRGRRSR